MSHLLQESTIATVREVEVLRQELADTRKKLQDYADTVISLHGELRTLRDSICTSCKRKFLPANIVSSQPAAVNSSLIKSSLGPAEHTNPIFYRRRPLKAHTSGHIPRNSDPSTPEKPKEPTSNISQTFPSIPLRIVSTPTILNKAITPEPVPNVPRWFAKRDATANSESSLDVTFVREFVQKDIVRSVRFSADGKYLAAVTAAYGTGMKGVVFIYNVETGDKICELAEYASQYSSKDVPGIYCVCFSLNGRCLAVGDVIGRVTVWDIPNKRIRSIFRGHKFVVRSVDFSPNGRHVVSGSRDGTVRMWNTRDGTARVFNYASNVVWSVRFSPSGQLVAAGETGCLRMWDVRTGQLVRRWTGHGGSIRGVAFMSDGMELVTRGSDWVVKRWGVSSLATVQYGEPVASKILKCEGGSETGYAIAVSPDSRWIASGSHSGNVVIWDAHTAMRQCTLIGHLGSVLSVDFSSLGGYLALGSDDRHVTLWRYSGLEMIQNMQ